MLLMNGNNISNSIIVLGNFTKKDNGNRESHCLTITLAFGAFFTRPVPCQYKNPCTARAVPSRLYISTWDT